MFKKKYIVANWKQNKSFYEASSWCKEFIKNFDANWLNYLDLVICPSFVFLPKVYEALSPLGIFVGTQDISPFRNGAHTGFVGVSQIKPFASFSLVGHSERNESISLVKEKASLCLENGITPIICFKNRDSYFKSQGCIYALEDPQNISLEGVYRPKSVVEVKTLVKEAKEFFGDRSVVIYGGSVNNSNVGQLAQLKDLDGLLVGQASLDAKNFCLMIESFVYEIS